jgi:hypothetical protein
MDFVDDVYSDDSRLVSSFIMVNGSFEKQRVPSRSKVNRN